MSAFIRRFTEDPGNEVLLEIESVNILDLDPPTSITGVGTGSVIALGEYEDGDYNEPTEVASVEDLLQTFGGIGFNYSGVVANNPCARVRRADSALVDEYWNGNMAIQLNAKKFRRLIACRVDTSVGEVTMYRQAYVTGAAAFAYNLDAGQVLSLDIGAGPVSATFTAAAAIYTSAAGTYPTTFVGGETLTLGYDDAADFTVTFLAADQTKAQVISRINAYAGFTFATDPGVGIRLTSRRLGTGAQVRIVAASAPSVLTQLGMTVTTAVGTGNVADIDAVKFLEIKNIVEAAVAGTTVTQDQNGSLRIAKNYTATGDFIRVTSATTATALGFSTDQEGSNDGRANYLSSAGSYPSGFAGGETLTLSYDDQPPIVVTFVVGDSTQAQVLAKINATVGQTIVTDAGSGKSLFRGLKNGGAVRILGASSATVLTVLGIVAKTVTAPAVVSGKIPAGTVVQNSAASRVFVLAKSIDVLASNAGPYTTRVRHATDDGTGLSATAGTVTVVSSATPIALGSFSVSNLALINAALTEAAIDAAYVTALASTLDINSPARTANIVWSARQSNAVRRALRQNAIDASSRGLYGRVCCIRPPMGTLKAVAKSPIAEPGVGAYRSDRVFYVYPQVRTFVQAIATRGVAGGTGFTADGVVDVGADGFLASVCSQLAPEENPGQLTSFTAGVVGLESSPNALGFDIGDYTQFKAAGICAPRIDGGVAVFQSGVTSVDPLVLPNRKNIARRRMADFITDTLAQRAKAYSKKLSTNMRRLAFATESDAFLRGLLSEDQPERQRIAGYKVDRKSGNTADTIAQGLFRLKFNVRTLSSLDAIVLQSSIGEQVADVNELPEAA